MVVEIQNPVHLHGELGIGPGFPGLDRLPRHPLGLEDLAQSFAADLSDSVADHYFAQFRQAPCRERPTQITRAAPGDCQVDPTDRSSILTLSPLSVGFTVFRDSVPVAAELAEPAC
ncbi:hypothetical protein ACWEH3_34580 [Nocardia sp. NPDC004718]